MTAPTLLVVAKAPVPGLAKTRLAALVGDAVAADLAAAALLDTLAAVQQASTRTGWPVVVATTGEATDAARADHVLAAFSRTHVVQQRGDDFATRLAHAHADAAAATGTGGGTVQVGMDTPQLTADDLVLAGESVRSGRDVLGPATDGGWWLLGLTDPADAATLADVPMSRDDTARRTLEALPGPVDLLRELSDVDVWSDAVAVADAAAGTLFADAVHRATEVRA